jgi:hypothetical protein
MPGLVAFSDTATFTLADKNAPTGRATFLQRWNAKGLAGELSLGDHLGTAETYDAVWGLAAAKNGSVWVVGPVKNGQPGSQTILQVTEQFEVAGSIAFSAHRGPSLGLGSAALDEGSTSLYFIASRWTAATPSEVISTVCSINLAGSQASPTCNDSSLSTLAWDSKYNRLLGCDRGNATTVDNVFRLSSFDPLTKADDVLCNITSVGGTIPYYLASDGIQAWDANQRQWIGAFGRADQKPVGPLRLVTVTPDDKSASVTQESQSICDVSDPHSDCPSAVWGGA